MPLTQEETAKASACFKKFDKDNSGTIEKDEFTAMISELLDINPENTQKYIDLKFRQVDKDASSKISMEEFLAFYDKIKSSIEEK